jgi:serine/threonine protein kinase
MITHEHALKARTILNNYRIIRVLGAGGFGITYLAKDTKLGMEVVIKEYFPSDLAIRKDDSTIISRSSDTKEDYSKGMKRFKEEAQTLARFNHPSIVKILGYFEANHTAYFVM